MRKVFYIVFILFIPVMVYSNIPDTTLTPVNNQKQDWFNKGEWKGGFNANPDASIDIEALRAHYTQHTPLWEKVFDFLTGTDLTAIETGRYPLAGDSLFAIVDEYSTQSEEERKYEAHRKYIDLQYVISGQELIGTTKMDNQEVLEPYDKDRDIAFYREDNGKYRLADSSVFFIFFPDDAHQPCVSVDQNAPVRKIVFKIISDQ